MVDLPLTPSRFTRRQLLSGAAAATAAGGLAVATDAVTVGAHHLVVERIEVRLARLPERLDGFTIVQLSDFHYGWFNEPIIRSSVARTNELGPDVVVLTGDFVSHPYLSGDARSSARSAEPCAVLLSGLRARLGTFAVLGNHDATTDPDFVSDALSGHAIHVLRNSSVALERDGARLWLAGLDDVLEGEQDLDRALSGIGREESTLLLVHEPDYADHVARQHVHMPVDFQLSGHSHGGQIRFPLVGPLYLPELAQKYVQGLHQVGPMKLYTNRGVGTIGLPARLNCPPEITLFTLRRAV